MSPRAELLRCRGHRTCRHHGIPQLSSAFPSLLPTVTPSSGLVTTGLVTAAAPPHLPPLPLLCPDITNRGSFTDADVAVTPKPSTLQSPRHGTPAFGGLSGQASLLLAVGCQALGCPRPLFMQGDTLGHSRCLLPLPASPVLLLTFPTPSTQVSELEGQSLAGQSLEGRAMPESVSPLIHPGPRWILF